MNNNSQSNSPMYFLVAIFGGCLLVMACVLCIGVFGTFGIIQTGRAIIDDVNATGTALAGIPTVSSNNTTPANGSTRLPDRFDDATPTSEFGSPATIEIPNNDSATPDVTGNLPPAGSPTPPQPTATPIPDINVPADIDQQLPPDTAYQTYNRLITADYPPHDYYEAARRIGRYDVGDRTVPSDPYVLGDTQLFITFQGQEEATLMAVTEDTYFWVANDITLPAGAMQNAAQRFATDYYPLIVNLFGQEWRPGIDNDPHFSILHLAGLSDGGELGLFDAGDQYPGLVYPGSNEQEMFYINLDAMDLEDDLYFGTLVHEYQHMVQWYLDGNEETWLDEGLAQLAEIYVGLETADYIDYLRDPDTQLNTWSYDDEDDVFDYYAASYLFVTYLWEQLGDAAIQELARHPANGLLSVDAVLRGYQPDTSLDQFLLDWTLANWFDDPALDSRYGYQNLDLFIQPTTRYSVDDTAPFLLAELPQFGVDYVELDMTGPMTLNFAADTLVDLTGTDPFSGDQMWFVPPVDGVNAQLTGRFDLTTASQASLDFAAWYELEADYDFAYVSVSTDDGTTWELLLPDHGTAGDYGPAFNGNSADEATASNGWVQESISLTAYTGQEILIRFEVLTDSGISGRGFAIDDIRIDAIGFTDDVEGATTWLATGFVQTGRYLPQTWIAAVIDNRTNAVTPLDLNPYNQAQLQLDLPAGGILVVMPTTPFSYQSTNYWFELQQ